ncbi:MAG: sigma-70 family RNA polymerase sigma factor [Candidatus Aminicenantes bacterium]|nr:sigma-70 family RNA polymerase sigma factor [Candidatus Aminicenantes bacterium]
MGITITSQDTKIPEREIPDKKFCRKRLEESLVADEKAIYEQLIAPLESRMMRAIWRIVRHPEIAEDTLQNALTIVWKKLNRIRRHPNPQALILKICMNSAYDSLRKQKRFRKQEDSSSLLHEFPDLSGTTVPSNLERKRIEGEILKAISRLPRKQSMAVLMRIVQGQPYDVIAQMLDCGEITARIQVSRGRAKLSQWLSHLLPSTFKEAS